MASEPQTLRRKHRTPSNFSGSHEDVVAAAVVGPALRAAVVVAGQLPTPVNLGKLSLKGSGFQCLLEATPCTTILYTIQLQ